MSRSDAASGRVVPMDTQTSGRAMRHVSIRGRVQGVGYRAFVEREALAAGVEGWVRNCRDGSVEAVFRGSPDTVERLIAACRRGPYAARVAALDDRPANAGELRHCRAGDRFSVLPTA